MIEYNGGSTKLFRTLTPKWILIDRLNCVHRFEAREDAERALRSALRRYRRNKQSLTMREQHNLALAQVEQIVEPAEPNHSSGLYGIVNIIETEEVSMSRSWQGVTLFWYDQGSGKTVSVFLEDLLDYIR